MSLILEALRKSEAERQVGRPPGLLSPATAAEPETKRRMLLPLGIATVLAVAAGAWWLGTRSAGAPGAPQPDATARAAPTVPAQSTAASPEVNHPVHADPPPPSSDAAPPATPRQVKQPVQQEENLAVPATEPKPAPVESTAPDTPAAAVPVIPYARIDQMPAAERANLPDLKLTVHVYSEEPERRFAILDGRRRADGDVIQDGLSVEAILPDGVLLRVGGRTWMLPRP